MSDPEAGVDWLRALVERIAERVADVLGGNPAVKRVSDVLDVYDRAGGGLVAAGLAYTSLLALLPGLLLVLSIIGYLIRDPADQQRIVDFIGTALPPLKDLAAAAFEQVSRSAVPSGVIAVIGLLWGSSRFYANLDTAFSHIFSGAPRRNPVLQTIRGLLLTGILVVAPVILVIAGSVVGWLGDLAPDGGHVSQTVALTMDIASPIVTVAVFVLVVVACYRLVPSERVGWRPLGLPAAVVGVVLAVFTQLYALLSQWLVGLAALYGTLVAAFALLAWLSIGYNVLLVGAAWTRVRASDGLLLDVFAAIREREGRAGTEAEGTAAAGQNGPVEADPPEDPA